MERRTGRRRRAPVEIERRGIFSGNVTVRVGLIVVLFCMVFLKFYSRMYEGSRLKGPINDIFAKKARTLAIIYPEGDSTLDSYAHRVSEILGKRLSQKIPVYSDRKAGGRVLKQQSLILYGPVPQNRVARELSASFPFRFEDGRLGWGNAHWLNATDWRLVFLVPNPRSQGQYVLVYTASTAGRVDGINFRESPNFVPHDTTDYVLAVGDSVLAAGYFDKDSTGVWTLPDGALELPGR